MFDVLRNLFRPPTGKQKAADLADVRSGRELLVAARLIVVPRPPGVHLIPQGYLHLFRDHAVWRGHHHPEMAFRRGEWFVRTTPRQDCGTFGIVSFLSKADGQIHYEIRVPTPDLDLVESVLSDG
jgi:hypothetical protein